MNILVDYRQIYIAVSMVNKNGLIYCGNQFSTDPFCVTKLIQFLVSSILLLVIIYHMVTRYRQEREFLNLFFGLCTLMSLALFCNLCYCLDHRILAFNFLEGYFYNNYFVVIVYYVGYKLLQVMKTKKYYFYVLHGLFGVSLAFLLSVLIEKFVKAESSCQELWYLIVSGFCITLSIILTIVGASYTRRQIEKLEGIENPIHYKNPLPNIWIWISMNIFSQLCGLIESLIFKFTPSQHCHFSTNFGLDQAIKLMFVLLSFHLGMVSTIIFFRKKYSREQENMRVSHTRRASVNIQLIQQFSSPSPS